MLTTKNLQTSRGKLFCSKDDDDDNDDDDDDVACRPREANCVRETALFQTGRSPTMFTPALDR